MSGNECIANGTLEVWKENLPPVMSVMSNEIVYVDQEYTGESPAQEATAHHMQLEVVKLPEAKQGFVLLPRRWVVKRRFAWAGRFRRLARDYEQPVETLAGLHFVAFAILILKRFVELLV